jgi:signal transduction histidine kinase
LLWIAPRTDHRDGPWVIGVASDPTTLTSFLGDLHWHLDGVMLLTYLLIGTLGLFAVRGIGRAYERRLESEVRERTEAMESAHAQMLQRERLATIGQTASVLAHEMRNPLASIKLALSDVQDSDRLSEREHRRVELVSGEVGRLDNLLSQTLDYVRPIRLVSDPVLLEDVLTQVLHHEEPWLATHEVRIRSIEKSTVPLQRHAQAALWGGRATGRTRLNSHDNGGVTRSGTGGAVLLGSP